MWKGISLAITAVALAACEPSELRPVPVGGGSGGYSNPATKPVEPIAPAIPNEARIDDPDQPTEDQMIDYVWGDNADEAERNCRRIAENAGLNYQKVTKSSQRRGAKRYECWVSVNHPESTNIPYSDQR